VKNHAIVLSVLALAFLCRVAGQLWVVLASPGFLPPPEAWHSGLLPYPLLLPLQVAILAFQLAVSLQLWKGRGPLTHTRPAMGRFLKYFSLVYFLGMGARYGLTMYAWPEKRWLGDMIPICFHCLLALYLYVLSRHFRGLPLKS